MFCHTESVARCHHCSSARDRLCGRFPKNALTQATAAAAAALLARGQVAATAPCPQRAPLAPIGSHMNFILNAGAHGPWPTTPLLVGAESCGENAVPEIDGGHGVADSPPSPRTGGSETDEESTAGHLPECIRATRMQNPGPGRFTVDDDVERRLAEDQRRLSLAAAISVGCAPEVVTSYRAGEEQREGTPLQRQKRGSTDSIRHSMQNVTADSEVAETELDGHNVRRYSDEITRVVLSYLKLSVRPATIMHCAVFNMLCAGRVYTLSCCALACSVLD